MLKKGCYGYTPWIDVQNFWISNWCFLEIQFHLKYENFLAMVHSEIKSCLWFDHVQNELDLYRKHRLGIQNLGHIGLEEAFLFHCTCICAAILLPISDSLSCIFPKFCCCCILCPHDMLMCYVTMRICTATTHQPAFSLAMFRFLLHYWVTICY